MKGYKKYLYLLVGLALSLVLVGCGPQDDGEEKASGSKDSNKEYDLLVWEDQDKADGIEDAIAKFEEENDVKIKVVEKAYAKQIEDLRLDGPAGTGPDVLTMAGDQMGTAVTEGLLKDLNIGDDIQSIYTDEALLSQMVDGRRKIIWFTKGSGNNRTLL